MGFGFMMRKSKHEDEEMRRRRGHEENPWHSHHPDFDDDAKAMEMRRRRGHEENPWHSHHPDFGDDDEDMEMRRRRSHYYPDEDRKRMGYVRDTHDDLRATLHDISHKLDKALEGGYASVKTLAPNLEGVLDDAAALLEDCPKTWEPYLKHKDYLGIAKMEGTELLRAIEAKKPKEAMRKELVHTVAALLQLASA